MIHNEGGYFGYMIQGENSEYCQQRHETTLIPTSAV